MFTYLYGHKLTIMIIDKLLTDNIITNILRYDVNISNYKVCIINNWYVL